jgi:hypothetical protein
MFSKKYFILTCLMALFAFSGLKAQNANDAMYRGGGYDFNDTSLIPTKRVSQQRDFLNGNYDFPALPRNQWEIGISGGMLNISGDVRSKTLFNQPIKPLNTLGWGLSVRKAWGYVISTRLNYNQGVASGYNYEESENYYGHTGNPYSAAGYTGGVYYNYKTQIKELSLQVVAALNNLKFHRARNKFSHYFYLGAGGMAYHTMMDLKNNQTGNTNYNFNSISAPGTSTINSLYTSRKDINKELKNLFDGEYETESESHANRGRLFNKKYTLRPVFNIGLGTQIRLSRKLSLSIEDKMTITMDDLLDGYRWQERPQTDNGLKVASAMTRDFDNINYFSIGLNVNLGGKSVDPLWWMNPLDYGYNEFKNKKPVGPNKCDNDADGDGISDCFDRCPNTPGGVSVDSHGCPFDTDGDGVADYKDKQLITPTECQPVDADGVGKCPDPKCCERIGTDGPKGCNVSSGSISFASGSSKLSSSAQSQLNSLAQSMRANPNCKAIINGCGNGNKIEQQRSWDRVNSVINYMVDKQSIDRERFIFQYQQECDPNSVEFRGASTGEEGPSNVPPPFPNLRK